MTQPQPLLACLVRHQHRRQALAIIVIRRNGGSGLRTIQDRNRSDEGILAVNGGHRRSFARAFASWFEQLIRSVINALMRRQPAGGTFILKIFRIKLNWR